MENEIIGALEIEWVINNPQLLADLAKSESAYQAATDKIAADMTKVSAAMEKLVAKGGFSDSQKEVEAYAASIKGLGDTGTVALSGTDALLKEFNNDLASGKITAAEFKGKIDAMAEAQARFAATTADTNAAETEQLGLLASLKKRLDELTASKPTLINKAEIKAANIEIEALNAEIKRLNVLGTAAGQDLSNAIEKPIGKFNRLQYAAKLYEEQARTATNPDIISKYNSKLEAATIELNQLKNIGKTGFDEMGNAVAKSTNLLGSAWGGLRKLAIILPGIGAAGIVAFAVEPIISYIAKLDILGPKFSQMAANLKAFNEVNKQFVQSVSTQVTSLNILYKAATDVNNSMEDRVRFANELKGTYPNSFANSSTQAILNGEEAKSYKQLTQSIIEQAKAKAVADKIAEVGTTITLAEIQQQKIKNAHAQELIAAQKLPASINSRNTDAIFSPRQDAINGSNDREKESLKKQQDIIDQGNRTVKFLYDFAGSTAKLADTLSKNNDLIKEPLKNFDTIIKNANGTDLENLKKSLEDKLKRLPMGDALIKTYGDKIKEVEALQKQYSPKTTDGQSEDNAAKTLLAAQTSELQKIDGLKDKYAAKAKSRDDQAADAIKANFKAQVDAINALNIKYDAFVTKYGVAAATAAGLKRIDPNSLKGTETDALAALSGTQSLEQTKIQVEKQKAIFKQYEDFKLKAGTDAANTLYANEIKGFTSYLDYLTKLQPTEAQLTSANPAEKAAANARKDYLDKEIPAANIREVIEKGKHLQDLLIQNQSYDQKTQQIIEQGLKDISLLRDQWRDKEADNLANGLVAELNLRNLHGKEIEDSYRTFGDSIERLTASQAKVRIEQAKNVALKELVALNITAEQYKKIIADINNAEAELGKNTILNAADALSSALNNVSQSLSGIDGQLSHTIGSLAKGLTQMAELARNVSKLKDVQANFTKDKAAAGGGFLGTVSGIAGAIPVVGGVISGVISAVGSVVNFFNEASETAKASAEELINFVTRGIDAERAYERQMRERARTQQDINALTLTELNARKQMLSLQADQAKSDYERLLAGAANGAFISGEHSEKYGGFLGIAEKTKVVADLASTSGKDYDELEKLYIEGKLTDSTKAWFEQLKAAKDEMDAIGVSAKDTLAAINKVATGTTADAIASAIVEGFKQGKRTAADFADDFKTLMDNAAISVFESNYLSKKIADFYDQFAAESNSDGGLTADKIKALKDSYAKLINDAGKEFDTLGTIIGSDLSSTSQNTMAGKISAITVEDAEKLIDLDFRKIIVIKKPQLL